MDLDVDTPIQPDGDTKGATAEKIERNGLAKGDNIFRIATDDHF